MRTAVIVPTYNRTDALAAVLEGFLAQDDLDFELVVADDGSTPDTRAVVEAFQKRAPFRIKHVWHEDQGFRLSAIRNRAAAATNAEYLIFNDGDCIPPPYFVATHKRLAERGSFLAGNRLLLSEDFTRRILASQVAVHSWSRWKWLGARVRGNINRWLPLVRLPNGGFRRHVRQRWQGVKTCNMSVWREDLLRVNGMDEAFSGWGLEDSDLVIRLYRAGVRQKTARFSAPVFHLWHRESDRSKLPDNQKRFDELLHSDRVRAAQGIDRYL
jgi:glycosyltransferase involved in cell wall biosynthesis